MLGCGDVAYGYSSYMCFHCGWDEKKIAFSCKSGFCLSCGKVYVDKWVAPRGYPIGQVLHPGLMYRHAILTVPDGLRNYFYHGGMELLGEFMGWGVRCLEDVLNRATRRLVKGGYIVVLQTAGRSGGYNPHLHIIMTSGGVDEEKGRWVELKYFPYELLHKKWGYYLLSGLREFIDNEEIEEVVDWMWKRYPKGLVAHIKKGQVPEKSEGLATGTLRVLAKYVVSPPISIRRIISYDGEQVSYWYKDHSTNKVRKECLSAFRFIGRMVQHILPKGFKRVRYYGLQATRTFNRVKEVVSEAIRRIGRAVKGAYRGIGLKRYRDRYQEVSGKDPFVCSRCGSEMDLCTIWHPKYGIIYDEFKEMEKGKYEQRLGIGSGGVGIPGRARVLQLSLPGLWV